MFEIDFENFLKANSDGGQTTTQTKSDRHNEQNRIHTSGNDCEIR
jgi:hypothetical protein